MKLDTKPRELSRKNLKELRKGGGMPIVCYGPKSTSEALSVALRDFNRVWKEAGETTVITLSTKEGEVEALIHEVDEHPVTGEPMHADFYVMEKGKPVQVMMPLEFVGESPAVKDLGGTLVKVLHEVEIEAVPKDLPGEIKIDIGVLEKIEDTISVKDLKVGSAVTVLTDEEEIIASVSVQEEEPEEAPEEVDFDSAVEVEQKGKDDAEASEETS